MAFFTLEADYSGETGYPFDNSRQIGIKYVLIWKWNGFNFESEQSSWLSPSILTDNLIEDGLTISDSLCTAATSLQKEEGRRSVCGGGGDCTQASLSWIIHL